MKSNTIGIYHGSCIDGTAAAAVLRKRFLDAALYPLKHGYSAEDITPILETVTSDTVCYLVDCTLGLKELIPTGATIHVYDHHISVKEETENQATEHGNVSYVFDINKSGASLTWSELFPAEPLPEIIKYVEDNDLWNGEFGDTTKHVTNYLSMWRNDPDAMLELIEGDLNQVLEKGAVISKYTDDAIERLVDMIGQTLLIDGHRVPAFNITDHQSQCGNLLSAKHDVAVALYTLKGGRVNFSFRALGHHSPSALDHATHLGGGGHQNSAGASVSTEIFIQMLQIEDDE